MSDPKNLYEVLTTELGKRHIEGIQLPLSITQNLNPKLPIRPYQERAFRYFINYWQEDFEGKPRSHHQLLMLMATGSGKTMMMAGLVAYLYTKGYRKFLFFVNSTNIINKTRDNFLNSASSKYLFAPTIAVGDRRVQVREVETFQSTSPDDINIIFTTIQGLHTTLLNPRENSVTFDDFEGDRVVMVSDEAHHINADTKKGAKAIVDQDELFEAVSWERTVERIFRSNESNVLLEFTATVDLSDPDLAAKYRPRLLVDYPLREFRKDGYSKEVKVLQSDLDPWPRALQAVVLSQYRRKVFEKYGKAVLPVMLFKSKTIKESKEFFEAFVQGIKALQPTELVALTQRAMDPAIQRAFDYFYANGIAPDNLVAELKEDFSRDKLLEVNSKEESEEKQLLVNSLETNGLRVVFAVDKLNEGWDVLNLYDIVRLYNTRDGKANAIGKTTMSEAQLIGRGARYCPFQLSPEHPLYMRKFDADVGHEARILEELYYHSAHNPKYVQELHVALQAIGLKAQQTREVPVHLKTSFKETPLYKGGFIFLNERVPYKREDVRGLPSSLIHTNHAVALRTGYTRTTLAFEQDTNARGVDIERKDYTLLELGLPVLRKAVQCIEFFEFSHLRRYLPHLVGIQEFLTSPAYLGLVKAEVSGLRGHVQTLTPDQKLDVALQVLQAVADTLASDNRDYKGSAEFKPAMVKSVFTDKTLNFMLEGGEDKEFGRSMANASEGSAYHLDLSSRAWYAFEDCHGTSEEKLLIQYIDKRYAELQKVYAHAYLVRNEKHFKLYTFDDGRALEPDFVLFLIGKSTRDTMHFQVFIEPKGQHLLRADAWKEKFLQSIKDQGRIEQLMENRHYVVWGFPFFNHAERAPEFTQAFDQLLV